MGTTNQRACLEGPCDWPPRRAHLNPHPPGSVLRSVRTRPPPADVGEDEPQRAEFGEWSQFYILISSLTRNRTCPIGLYYHSVSSTNCRPFESQAPRFSNAKSHIRIHRSEHFRKLNYWPSWSQARFHETDIIFSNVTVRSHSLF